MKKQPVALFLLAALTLTVLAGCQSANVDTPTTAPLSVMPLSYIAPPTTAPLATQAPQQESVPATTQPAMLTPQEAEAIALAHADVAAENARMDRTELDTDMRALHYEVEFRAGDYEYDYKIDARNGQVLHWEWEYDPVKTPEPTKPQQPSTQPPSANLISAKEAEAIALAHAGLQAEDVRFSRTELDRDGGIVEYEVEFRYGKWEYSYDIHAETGKILAWEKELDD